MTHTVFIHWTLGMTRVKQIMTENSLWQDVVISVSSPGNSVSGSEVQGQVNGTDWQQQQTSDGSDTWEVWGEEAGADLSLQQSHFIKYV